MKQLWKKFDKLTEICYMSELEDNCPQWDEAYEVFKQLVAQGREKDPQYAAEILKMDDATDFAYGVADWIEDYLDELDAREEHEKLRRERLWSSVRNGMQKISMRWLQQLLCTQK